MVALLYKDIVLASASHVKVQMKLWKTLKPVALSCYDKYVGEYPPEHDQSTFE